MLDTPQAGEIESVELIRTPSPQHVNDSDQRILKLEFTKAGGDTLEAVAPPNGVAAPPGTYYLVVNKKSEKGPVPSVARMLRMGETDKADAIQPFADDAPAPVGGSATPDKDTSGAAQAQQQMSETAQSALGDTPNPGPAQTATQTTADAYQQLSAAPAGTSHPLPDGLPAAAIAVAGTAVVSGRRLLRRATT